MNQKALEAAARAVDRQLAFEVESNVRAHELTRDEQTSVAQAAIAAYLAAMEAEGFVMVPVEPTDDMVLDGAEPVFAGSGSKADAKAIEVYRAMIAARPRGEG